jgi:adenylate cyclase
LLLVAGISYAFFRFGRIWLNVTFLGLFIILDYLMITSYNLVITTYKYLTKEKIEKELKNAFQRYVSPKVVDQILETPEKLELGGERKIMTALFSDVRGFTQISESISPAELVQFLNDFFTEMTEKVLDYEGTVDKYIGDAIMVFFGAPLEQQDHAVRACKTAVDMIHSLKKLRVDWEALDLPTINLGVGINSGEMIVGNMGSKKRFNYTIMGDAVNLASRLEGINKQYGTNIIISQCTYNLIQGDSFTVRELDSVRVKGKKEPVTIYELCGYGELYHQKQELATIFSEGLHVYRKQQWEQAIKLFNSVLREYPDDTPSRVFIARCNEYKQNSPPEDWDGVFAMETK